MTTYTSGNWSVSSKYTDTTSTKKNVAVYDLTYASDFAKTMDEPEEARLANTTSQDITSPEVIRFCRSNVKDVYSTTDIDVAAQAPVKRGVQVMCEIHENFKATNSVTGQEIELPCVGRVVLRFPSFSCVNDTLVNDLLIRTVASALDTGKVDSSRMMEMARGSLLPN